ncbi:MAG: phosphate ABC transporter ATP-binding protein [Dehalococcoidia bacterium]|nr:phosphate ABC transporter ATP-binding protein [Dehalococcoidia bacterium]
MVTVRESEETLEAPSAPAVTVEHLNAYYGTFRALNDVSLEIRARSVTAVIGPSGCGKSTLVRCINRMHEVAPGASASGRVLVSGEDIYAPDSDPVQVRRHIGMVFQKPNPFPMMSVWQNVVAGLRLEGISDKKRLEEVAERSLRKAALWDEVKDKLHMSGAALSGGQQQRLCIARAIAMEPEVLLMDEPCSALDPVATIKIEDLIRELRESFTIIIVTHNMQQAARVSDRTAFMLMDEERAGQLIEYGSTAQIFTNPQDKRTEGYITGRFG